MKTPFLVILSANLTLGIPVTLTLYVRVGRNPRK